MGATRDDFSKYPRTPHLFGSKGTDDDKHLGREESEAFIADPSLIVEEKLDGTNVGIHFTSSGRMVLQCRWHEITEGMHPQYDLFKQWTSPKRALAASEHDSEPARRRCGHLGMKTWTDTQRATKAQILEWAEVQPWVRDMATCQQDAKWHSEGDVWTHTKMVCAELERLAEWPALDRATQIK